MAYVEPTRTDFLSRYPEFSSLDTALIDEVLAEAIAEVSDSWIEDDRRRAQMLLTAHWLMTEGRLSSGTSAGVAGGPIKSMVEGDVEIAFSASQDGSAAGWTGNPNLGHNLRAYPGFTTESYRATVYGLRYLDLKSRSFPAIATA